MRPLPQEHIGGRSRFHSGDAGHELAQLDPLGQSDHRGNSSDIRDELRRTDRAGASRCRPDFPAVEPITIDIEIRPDAPRRVLAAGTESMDGRNHVCRNGQADCRGGSGDRKVRMELRLLCGKCSPIPAGRPARFQCEPELRSVHAAGNGPCCDALEFPILAGVPVRRPGADGRKHGHTQARIKRPGVRPRHRRGVPAGRIPRGRFPESSDPRFARFPALARSPNCGRDADRE